MSARDLAAIAFRTLAVWLFASGIAGLCSSLLTWTPNVAQYGREITGFQLAASAVFVPIGALLWLASERSARLAFPQPEQSATVNLSRADLYAFASVLVGMFLLSDALSQIAYWIVVWRSSRGTGFWSATSQGSMENTVVYWVHVRAQAGLVAAKTLLGLALVFGPERLKTAVLWIRRELRGSLSEPPSDESGGDSRGAATP